jgi:hypothetical protein
MLIPPPSGSRKVATLLASAPKDWVSLHTNTNKNGHEFCFVLIHILRDFTLRKVLGGNLEIGSFDFQVLILKFLYNFTLKP